MNFNYGFLRDEEKAEDYIFGGEQLEKEVLTDGSWVDYVPTTEHQSRNVETMACVSFGTNSALEMIHKVRYRIEPNYSDRYIARMSDTTPQGNSPRKVADTIRKIAGEIKEVEYPYEGKTWEEYYKEIPDGLLKSGAKWIEKYDFGYEWVMPENLKEALKYSPIGVGVYAWVTNDKGEYISLGAPNHWCILIGYDDYDRPLVFDSYEQFVKILEKDYPFEICMRYHLKKKENLEEKESLIKKLYAIIKRWLS